MPALSSEEAETALIEAVEGASRDADPGFEAWTTEVGEHSLPAYTYDADKRERVAERRAEHLEATHPELGERSAFALAAFEVGEGTAWTAEYLDVTEATASNYLDRIGEALGEGVFLRSADEVPIRDIEAGLPVDRPHLRTCPASECGADAVVSVFEADRAFATTTDEMRRALDGARESGATHVCRGCCETYTLEGHGADSETAVRGHYRNVPDPLRERARWLCWEYQTRGDDETKVPIAPWADAVGGVDAHNPFAQTTFDEALDWAQKVTQYGLGFLPVVGGPFVCIDLDGVVDEEGNIDERAREVIERCDSYTEFSPTDGIHVWLRADDGLPDGLKCSNEAGWFEAYDSNKYITVTGDVLRDRPIRGDQALVDELAEEFLPEHSGGADGGVRTVEATVAATEFDGDSALVSDLYGLRVTDVFPEIPVGEYVEHPCHDSKTGSNFKVRAGGSVGMCWRHEYGGNDEGGCALSALHLLAMEATGRTECDDVRHAMRPLDATPEGEAAEGDRLTTEAYVNAVQNYDLDPVPIPRRVKRDMLAESTGGDPEMLHSDDAAERRDAHELARTLLRRIYDIQT